MSKEITIRLDIDEKQEEALRELLPYWQQYEGKDGSRPFENWTIAELLEALVCEGSRHTIWRRIKLDQHRKKLITNNEWIDDKYLTVAERAEERKIKEGGNDDRKNNSC